MKVVILAGGFGTRLSEETAEIRPKPMVEVGGKPILWHILKLYSYYGFNEFVICLGYKGYVIKEYFANYFLHQSDVTIDMRENKVEILDCKAEQWKITLIDTGLHTMTGGRIKRIEKYVLGETFMLTYGDGLGDVDIAGLMDFHKDHGRYATMTAVQPPGRFGALNLEENTVIDFCEKPRGDNSWINAGFFLLEPAIFDYITADETVWEKEPLQGLAKDGQLNAFRHKGFWKPMDTLRDKIELEKLWNSNQAPWKLWG